MPAETKELPHIPDDIIEGVFKAATLTPRSFVRATVAQMSDRPYSLHSYLVDALRLSKNHGEHDALHYLRQVLVIPACFNQVFARVGSPVIRVSKKTMESVYGELGGLSEIERQAVNAAMTGLMVLNNPLLIPRIQELAELSGTEGVSEHALTQGQKKAVRAFQLYARQIQDPHPNNQETDYGPDRKELPTDQVPLIRGSIIDQVLLEISIDKAGFVRKLFEEISSVSADLNQYVHLSSSLNGPQYMLIYCLVSHAFWAEYRERGQLMPTVSLANLNNTASRLMKSEGMTDINGKKFQQLEDLVRRENPHLLASVNLVRTIFSLPKIVADFALDQAYQSIRAQAESDYWERKMGK